MIEQTFTAADHESLVKEIAAFLRAEDFHVVHNSLTEQKRMSYRQVAEKYGLTPGALTSRLKNFRFEFPHERGVTRILWMVITPELHLNLSRPLQRQQNPQKRKRIDKHNR